MSIRLMSLVFDADIEDLPYTKDSEQRKAKASTVKLLLLAYADHANDEGEGSYPGYTRLERKTALSRQGIADTLEAVRQNGFMTFEGWSKLDTHKYSINKAKLESLVKPLDSQKKERVKPLDSAESSHLTPTSQATGLNPSSTSSTSLTAEELEDANALVELQLQASKKAKYDKRKDIPEPYLPFADLFVELSGLKPNKKNLTDWLATFSDWISEGLALDDIRRAWEHANRPDGFIVTRPGSLTTTAVALKAKPAPAAKKVEYVRADPNAPKHQPPAWIFEKQKELHAKLGKVVGE